MKKIWPVISIAVLNIMVAFMMIIPGCKKDENPIKYTIGTFPDSVYALTGLNSANDDYNSDIPSFSSQSPIIFSSNRGSSGGQYDLVQGALQYLFLQTTGEFSVSGYMTDDLFYGSLVTAANTAGNDFGPNSVFSSSDGFEYLLVASQGTGGQLDLRFIKHFPRSGNAPANVTSQGPVTIMNSSGDDAYISFDANEDSVYFCSNRSGNFEIYVQKRNTSQNLDSWFSKSFEAASVVDSVKSAYDEKCPFILKIIMIFASNRPGGMGGYDLYYSLFKSGKWGFPINMGPDINTMYDEFRPLIGYDPEFSNYAIVFSSNRPGGKGGFDLYFTGYSFQ